MNRVYYANAGLGASVGLTPAPVARTTLSIHEGEEGFSFRTSPA